MYAYPLMLQGDLLDNNRPRTQPRRLRFLPMQTVPTRDGESQAFMLPSSFSKNTIISPRSAPARSDDKKAIILFSTSTGLFFLQIQQMYLEILHPSS